MNDHEVAEVEAALNTAIEADLKLVYDEDYSVISYIVVAEVMDSEGAVGLRWTVTDGVPKYRVWGMFEWLKRRFAQQDEDAT